MRVASVTQLRIVLAVALVAAAMLVALGAYRQVEQGRVGLLVRERSEELSAVFDRVVELTRRPVQKHVEYEYTLWDELVEFTRNPDSAWAEENLDAVLLTYDLDAVWVLDTGFRIIYAAGRRKWLQPSELPVPESALRTQFRRAFVRFFTSGRGTPVEVTGSPVHGTSDSRRARPAAGYYLVAKRWDDALMAELSGLTQADVRLTGSDRTEPGAITRVLRGWDERPLARISVRSRSTLLTALAQSARRETALLLLFTALLTGLLFLMLARWVNRPLAALSRSLAQGSPAPIERLAADHSEFGRVARMVRDFFGQQTELVRHRGRLEELVAERTRELEKAHEALVRRERLAALGQIAGSVAHELRNPLGAIRNAAYYLNLVLTGPGAGHVARHVATIDKEVARSNRIIESLLDFARGRTLEPGICRVGDIVAAAVEHARLPAEVAVDVIVPPGLPALQVDRSQMTQVFANLLLNAAQAMGQRGTVTVSAAQRDGRVEVAVADKGTGIAPENMGRLFEPLFSTKTFGVGLGLAICRSFVEAHGGTIVVESEPGKGAKFTVALPVEQSGGTRC